MGGGMRFAREVIRCNSKANQLVLLFAAYFLFASLRIYVRIEIGVSCVACEETKLFDLGLSKSFSILRIFPFRLLPTLDF